VLLSFRPGRSAARDRTPAFFVACLDGLGERRIAEMSTAEIQASRIKSLVRMPGFAGEPIIEHVGCHGSG
jgi:hypothetical protein